jgi:hypothetical protein
MLPMDVDISRRARSMLHIPCAHASQIRLTRRLLKDGSKYDVPQHYALDKVCSVSARSWRGVVLYCY